MISAIKVRGHGLVAVEATVTVLSCDDKDCSFYEMVLGTSHDDVAALIARVQSNGWKSEMNSAQDLCPNCRRDVPGSALDDH